MIFNKYLKNHSYVKTTKISQYDAVPNGCLYRSSIRGCQSRRTDLKITQQSGTCTGVVKDATGETVIGASVVVKGTTNGTITDFDGNFTLNDVKNGDVIQISFVGYITQEMKWNGTPLNVILKDDTQTLDEVVVVGYGGSQKTCSFDYCYY